MSLSVDLRATFTAEGATPFTVDVDLDVAGGETLVVLGPSGSGKSLLLESIAGVRAHDGNVAIDGLDVGDAPPEGRGFGFVFQDYALFPHLSVRENVAYGTRYHDDTRDPDALLADLDVADLAERAPETLSGGEKQRVALARALAVRPDAFLLDEPLSALDVPTRAALRATLADVLDGETAVYVTHDRTTARAMADRVAVMARGEVRQIGDVETVFERPNSPFVAEFTGANCLPRAALPASVAASLPDGTHAAIRPEHVVVDATDPDVTAPVVRVVREDARYRVTVALGDENVDAFANAPPDGQHVDISIPSSRCHVLTETDDD